jgi:hypothetical protein
VAVPPVVRRYAPLVVLHRDEKLLPSSAEKFVAESRLRWAKGRGQPRDVVPSAAGTIELARLGAASTDPYEAGGHPANAYTRPLDGSADRLPGVPLEEGFFLELRAGKAARGDPGTMPGPERYAGSPVYYQYDEPAQSVTYWLFYSGSAPPLGLLRPHEQLGLQADLAAGTVGAAPSEDLEQAAAAAMVEELRRVYPDLVADATGLEAAALFGFNPRETLGTIVEGVKALLREDNVLHEGDWERITVYLDAAEPAINPPVGVAFYRHAASGFVPWSQVKTAQGSHPTVYSAIGSHASLPAPDFGFVDVGDRNGRRWRTWDDLLPVREQPWYGFGGAWGRVGRVRDATGPLGPGPRWKQPAARP